MSISLLIQALRQILKDAYDNRNDPTRWGGWIDVHGTTDPPGQVQLSGCFTGAQVELSGIQFTIMVNGADLVLEGRPNLQRIDVYVNGALDPDAGVVVSSKGTPTQPLRVALDFRPVTFNGHECRFNLRYAG